ncbi:MAG: T9SS type A sorting domain-containing protein [Ginsengibacter sp.]
MEKKFIFYLKTVVCTVLTFSVLVINSFTAKTFAQSNCTNPAVLFSETFGTGTSAVSSTDILPTGLTYQATGPLANEGIYRIINNTQQKPEWHVSEDHTPNDINGRALVVNGKAETFYIHQINRSVGFAAGDYTVNLFLMNVNTPGTCAPDPLLPVITFRVEYLSPTNTWIPLTGSPFSSNPVAQTVNPTWAALGSAVTVPLTGTFLVTTIRIVLADGTVGGCGNDFAIDDITFSQCATGGTTPVQLLNFNARQKGSGVSVEWSTSQEINSKSFVIEKSTDGNSNWSDVTSVNAAGNSSTVKNYNAYDARPLKGFNFYRLKQVDIDGNYKYSKTVSVKINLNTTGVSVLTNPFHNSLTVDFSSATNQAVSARLVDITGKEVAAEKWSINTGSTRKEFSNISGLQQGMYIITVSGAGGEILYNNKVIKQ